MERENVDPEGGIARLSQEATNQSTPDKALADQKAKQARKLKIAPKRLRTPKPS